MRCTGSPFRYWLTMDSMELIRPNITGKPSGSWQPKRPVKREVHETFSLKASAFLESSML